MAWRDAMEAVHFFARNSGSPLNFQGEPSMTPTASELADCLGAELFEAVQVACRHGATVWAAMNYPKWTERIEATKMMT